MICFFLNVFVLRILCPECFVCFQIEKIVSTGPPLVDFSPFLHHWQYGLVCRFLSWIVSMSHVQNIPETPAKFSFHENKSFGKIFCHKKKIKPQLWDVLLDKLRVVLLVVWQTKLSQLLITSCNKVKLNKLSNKVLHKAMRWNGKHCLSPPMMHWWLPSKRTINHCARTPYSLNFVWYKEFNWHVCAEFRYHKSLELFLSNLPDLLGTWPDF